MLCLFVCRVMEMDRVAGVRAVERWRRWPMEMQGEVRVKDKWRNVMVGLANDRVDV